MVKSEDFMLFFVAIGFAAFGVMQMSHIPSVWAQYFMGIIVFLAAMTSAIAWNAHFRREEDI
jgi:hypothetical protein